MLHVTYMYHFLYTCSYAILPRLIRPSIVRPKSFDPRFFRLKNVEIEGVYKDAKF